MPTKRLTDLFVERVKPPPRGRVEYFDTAHPGLVLRITVNGSKSWCVLYRFNGRLRRFTLGGYPAIELARARKEAEKALRSVRSGIDPAAEKKARRNMPPPEADTFGSLVQDYPEQCARRNTAPETFKETKRVLESEDLAGWRNRPVSDIFRDVIDVIDRIAKWADVQTNSILTRLRALFNWVVEKAHIPSSSIVGLKPPTKERSRDRMLSGDEVRWFWRASAALEQWGRFVRGLTSHARLMNVITPESGREGAREAASMVLVPGPMGKFGPEAVYEPPAKLGKPLGRLTVIPRKHPVRPSRLTDQALDQILDATRVPEQYRSTVKPLVREVVDSPFDQILIRDPISKISGRNVRTPLRRIARGLRKGADEIESLDPLQRSLLSQALRQNPRLILEPGRRQEILDIGCSILFREIAAAIGSEIDRPRNPPHRPPRSAKNAPLKFLVHALRTPIEEVGHGDLGFKCDESGCNCKGPLVDVLEILRDRLPPGVIPKSRELKRSMLRRDRRFRKL
jgi:hypothetical protein